MIRFREGGGAPGERTLLRRGPFRRLSLLLPIAAILFVAALSSCIVPVDTGANAAAIALEEMDALSYSMRDEVSLLQSQIDSLTGALRRTDSLLRWVANLTGNPIVDHPLGYIPPP